MQHARLKPFWLQFKKDKAKLEIRLRSCLRCAPTRQVASARQVRNKFKIRNGKCSEQGLLVAVRHARKGVGELAEAVGSAEPLRLVPHPHIAAVLENPRGAC